MEMSKELEALKIGIPKLKKLYENNAKKMSGNDIFGFDLTFSYLDKALKRLEAIDSANPSEALECLEVFLDRANHDEFLSRIGVEKATKFLNENQEKYNTIKAILLKTQEQEKVLEIIKEKEIDTFYLRQCFKVKDGLKKYNNCCKVGYKLKQEEFELLRSVLGE